jgi:hypothetical protein
MVPSPSQAPRYFSIRKTTITINPASQVNTWVRPQTKLKILFFFFFSEDVVPKIAMYVTTRATKESSMYHPARFPCNEFIGLVEKIV